MRLEKIKLAGFKSFVDPTTVTFPSNLVGVVGPNGCGKSNVIDAVRWVMGESSAKMLRGESMADVIFNGSTSRKPVGAATIELLFDNADGGAGGQYASYSQISVKRQVSRDGQSSYFLNGSRCRRKDITDLFLGTGLGPRSYSIIEQGMISRFIEARPEDLRSFLEEAAGISKYKERRRETENRIRSTRENLERLSDLREEVAKQLHHLERQAAAARRYRELKEEEHQLRAEVLGMRWQVLQEQLGDRDRRIAALETELERVLAEQRHLEAVIETKRQAQHDANERFNEVQARFYSTGAEIGRLEQAIQFARDRAIKQQQDLAQADAAKAELVQHLTQDRERLSELSLVLESSLPQLEEARALEDSGNEEVAESELQLHAWQAEWDSFNQRSAEPAQTAQAERARINQIEAQEQRLGKQIERVEQELARIQEGSLESEIAVAMQREEELSAVTELLAEQMEDCAERVETTRRGVSQRTGERDAFQSELQVLQGRRASLEALQDAALGREGGAVNEWMTVRGLEGAPRLAEMMDVDSGWQAAAETVIGRRLQAVCIEDLDAHIDALGESAVGLSMVETQSRKNAETVNGSALSSRIRGPSALDCWTSGVKVADSLSHAAELRTELCPGESVVTRDGLWMGPGWLVWQRGADPWQGSLERAQEIKQVDEQLVGLKEKISSLSDAIRREQEGLHGEEARREELRSQEQSIQRERAGLTAALGEKKARLENLRQRRHALQAELEELRLHSERDREDASVARHRLHAALASMEDLAARRPALIERRDTLRSRIAELRGAVTERRALTHQLALRVESARSAEQSLRENAARMERQLEQLEQRRQSLVEELASGEAPQLELEGLLEEQLAKRLVIEQELASARSALDELDQSIREHDRRRHQAELAGQGNRDTLEKERMERQSLLARADTIHEQLREAGLELGTVLQALPADGDIERWDARLEAVRNRVQRLGAINLAAIDEFNEQSQRKEYLDAQYEDINSSLETLENAIKKIDRETRSRFREVFEAVNQGLQQLFPRLFGGGHAYLELTGEDLLDTGVAVMARPPGKRNSSIHLLSGGEKALTAVALVFAIFQLNPAPFCMLDEVDAPLDDANVGRFCELVTSMSERVQFVFITHNKVTMEMANQLIGVTMQEAGVSRLVSVDVEEAAQLAAV